MLKEKVKGAILGSAIGDALGTPVEEMDRKKVLEVYKGVVRDFLNSSPFSVCPHLKKGQYSHETQVFLMVVETYIEKGYFDAETYTAKLVNWVRNEKEHRYPSGSHINTALAVLSGLEGEDAKVKASDIDGAIPAVAGGIYRWENPTSAYSEGVSIASVTHTDDTLLDVAGTLAVAVSLFFGKAELNTPAGREWFLNYIAGFAKTSVLRNYIKLVKELIKSKNTSLETAILTLGNGSFAPETLSIALFIALTNLNNFELAVLKAANSYSDFGGDTDAIAFMVGAMIGAYLGFSAIPQRWVKNLENSSYIETLSERLADVID